MLTPLRLEIEHTWEGAGTWPQGLPPAEAAAVRQFIQAANSGAFQILNAIGTSTATAADPEGADAVQRAAASFWDDARRIAGDGDWKRAVIWTALSLSYLRRLPGDGWPASVTAWLTAVDTILQQWLRPDVREMVVRTAIASPIPARAAVPSVAPPLPPPVPPRFSRDPLEEISLRTPTHALPHFRSGAEPPPPASAPAARAVAPDARRYDVWFGTNRAPGDPSTPSRAFTNERDPDGRVHYGSCSVEVPRTHTFGSTGTAWWKRWARFNFKDDHLRLVEIVPFETAADYFSELRAQMKELAAAERQVLVYIHGYNVSFEEAALRAAQIGFDLKVPGVTAFFSWPSSCTVKGYFADQDRIESSEQEIADFLVNMARGSGAETVHILAHSMGNRGLARAIQRIAMHAAREGDVRFGQIILAAPDVSVELFRELAAVYPTLSAHTTMYASAKDRALSLSGFLQDGIRAGYTPPTTVVNGIDTIEVTDIDLTLLGHGYYAAAEAVLYDMAQLLHSFTEPDRRPRLRAEKGDAGPFWRIGA